MEVKEFQEKGFLQEVNRKFFHPLGLVLSVYVDEANGSMILGEIWDYRNDPEGIFFKSNQIDRNKIEYVEGIRKSKVNKRLSYKLASVDEDGLQIT